MDDDSTEYDQKILDTVVSHLTSLKAAILAALSYHAEEQVTRQVARKLLADDISAVIYVKQEELDGSGGVEAGVLTPDEKQTDISISPT